LINIETTLQVESFPIHYIPVRYPFFGINSTVSGVGYNIARALSALGDAVSLLSIIGKDSGGHLAVQELKAAGLSPDFVVQQALQTAQSVILYDREGRRQINVDLKDIQDQQYPEPLFRQASGEASLLVLCNVNYSRPLLRLAKQAGKIIATDVHAISSLDDAYNQDFMAAADILFLSDELIPEPPADFIQQLTDRFAPGLVVIGMGARGALLYQRTSGTIVQIPSVTVRPVVSTIGAGDALFSSFLHYYSCGFLPVDALRRAVIFAGYKIGTAGAAQGFLDEIGVEAIFNELDQA
jgi:acarbose 7IV-phosphotransferase